MSLALAHLGREVVERAAESGASVGGRVHRPSEVRNLNRALLDRIKVSRKRTRERLFRWSNYPLSNQKIFWFDVPMNDVLVVAVLQRLGEITYIPAEQNN